MPRAAFGDASPAGLNRCHNAVVKIDVAAAIDQLLMIAACRRGFVDGSRLSPARSVNLGLGHTDRDTAASITILLSLGLMLSFCLVEHQNRIGIPDEADGARSIGDLIAIWKRNVVFVNEQRPLDRQRRSG